MGQSDEESYNSYACHETYEHKRVLVKFKFCLFRVKNISNQCSFCCHKTCSYNKCSYILIVFILLTRKIEVLPQFFRHDYFSTTVKGILAARVQIFWIVNVSYRQKRIFYYWNWFSCQHTFIDYTLSREKNKVARQDTLVWNYNNISWN